MSDQHVEATVAVQSTGPWATLRLLGGATWGRAATANPDAYVLRDRKTLRLFAPCVLAMTVIAPAGVDDVEIDVCKGVIGRVTVRTDDDIAWNALDGPLAPERHHCKKVLLVL